MSAGDPPAARPAGARAPESEWRLEHTLAVIDAANSVDPNWAMVRGRERPKELAHAELVSEWVLRLNPHAGEALRLAARAHHLERWRIPRDSYPPGRSGYLRWRKRLQLYHAERAGILLAGEQYPEETILRVQELIRKRGFGRDPDVQVLEDAMCLAFVETQFSDLAERTPEKILDITRKTLVKMSDAAKRLALALPLPDRHRALLLEAAASLPEPGSELEGEAPDADGEAESLPGYS